MRTPHSFLDAGMEEFRGITEETTFDRPPGQAASELEDQAAHADPVP
jgi:hypothetical protein